MSSSKALASLTASYTDSENEDGDNKEETSMEIESEDEVKEVENIDDDLPPEPPGKCAQDIQDKITGLFNRMQNDALDMNKEIQSRKTFRNPSIYEKLIDYCNLNECGTNYPPDIYNPFHWGKESHYDELAKIQKTEMDRREKERKEKTKVEIVSGTAKKVSSTNGVAVSSSVISADGEKRRKSKWDQQ